jgi:hypothetical protein
VERDTFDRFVRLFASGRNRRDALRLAAAATLLGGAATMEGAAAKRRRNRKRIRAQAISIVPCPGPPGLLDCSNKPLGPGKNLSRCDFAAKGAFFGVNLRGANISGASFFLTDLFGPPSFRSANASNVCFGGGISMAFADFRGANVSGSNFCDADLRGADFRGSNVTAGQLACAMVGCDTILPNGKPAVPCDADQVCCGAVCCAPENCVNDFCEEPPAP